jgi:hypothetical protein
VRAFLVDHKLGNASPSRFLCFVRFSVLRKHKRLRGRHSSFRIVYACVSDDVGFGAAFSFVVLDVGQLVLISVAQYFSLDTLSIGRICMYPSLLDSAALRAMTRSHQGIE